MTAARHERVSIVVPFYNTAPFIGDCVRSILGQDYGDFECILVDDGSTDGSADRVLEAAAGDARFRCVSLEQNRGVSTARNEGKRSADGRYLLFLDSDDVFHPQMLSCLVADLENNEADFAMCLYRLVDEEFSLDDLARAAQPISGSARISDTPLAELLTNKLLKSGSVCNKLFRRELVAEDFFDEDLTFGEDQLFLYRVLLRSRRFSYREDKMIYYRQHGVSACATVPIGSREGYALRIAELAATAKASDCGDQLKLESARIVYNELLARPLRLYGRNSNADLQVAREKMSGLVNDGLFEASRLPWRRSWMVRLLLSGHFALLKLLIRPKT